MTILLVFAGVVVAALAAAGLRSSPRRDVQRAFARAARRSGLRLKRSRSRARGQVRGVIVHARLFGASGAAGAGRPAVRCRAALVPPLAVGLAVRAADELHAHVLHSGIRPSGELSVTALHADLAERLLAGPVGARLRELVMFRFEPRLRDHAVEVWVAEWIDADRVCAAIAAAADLAQVVLEERARLPIAERVTALSQVFRAATDDLATQSDEAAGRFAISVEGGTIDVFLAGSAGRVQTVLELILASPSAKDADLAAVRAAIDGTVEIAGEGGRVRVEIGHLVTDAAELRRAVVSLRDLAAACVRGKGPYR